MNNKLKYIICALLIGNLHIRKRKNKYYSKYENDLFFFEYIKILFKKLEIYCSKKAQIIISKTLTKKKITANCYFNIKPLNEFTELRKEFYNNQGKKIIPKTIDNYMSIEFLVYLYLEIGTVDIEGNNFLFHFKHYDEESILRIQESMERVCNIKSELVNKIIYIQEPESQKEINSGVIKIMNEFPLIQELFLSPENDKTFLEYKTEQKKEQQNYFRENLNKKIIESPQDE